MTTTYRITSPRSRTDEASSVLWGYLQDQQSQRAGKRLVGLGSAEAHLCNVLEYRARRVRPEIRDRIDTLLAEAGFTPLRWTEEAR